MPIKLSPMPPKSAFESPAMRLAKSLVESQNAAPRGFLTRCEKTHYQYTGGYDETVALWRKIEAASPFAKMVKIGETSLGRDLLVFIASKDKAFSPRAAAKAGRPVIFIQNCIHPGEVSGKDATSMLLRDILVTKRMAHLLDAATILTMPAFNADGHENSSPWNRINQNGPKEMGFRATAQRLNLNRDYLKADAPEMRHWLKFFTEWLPDFFLDNHVTDGADHQYDLTIDIPTEQNIWPTVGNWVKKGFLPDLYRGMEADGHVMGPYTEPRDPDDYSQGMNVGVIEPRYSTSFVALHNRPGLLIETHSLKPHRTQVWSHYDVMRHTIEILGNRGAELRETVRAADAELATLAEKPGNKLFLAGTYAERATPYTFKGVSSHFETSAITARPVRVYGDEPVDIPTKLYTQLKTTAAPTMPFGYIVPRPWTAVIELLAVHGIRTESLKKAVTVECEYYRVTEANWSPQPFESRFLVDVKVARSRGNQTFPAGSVFVPMAHRAARVAFNLLEPEGPDSALRWGFFNTVFEQKEYADDYLLEPIARELFRLNPKAARDFQKKLDTDPDFAHDPRARFLYVYRLTPYHEPDKNLYPVVRVLAPFER